MRGVTAGNCVCGVAFALWGGCRRGNLIIFLVQKVHGMIRLEVPCTTEVTWQRSRHGPSQGEGMWRHSREGKRGLR